MKAKQDKCLNCGASINYNKVENGVYQCPYCREYYHIDEYGMIDEYKVKLKYMGKIIHCYLGSMKCEYSPQIDTYRTMTGELSINRYVEPQITFELTSYKIEDIDESKKVQSSEE